MRCSKLWAAAGVVVLAANLGAIVSGLSNRGHAPGGTLELTERELALPTLFEDSTVLLLELQWAAYPCEPQDERAPAWLTPAKLGELGFDCREPVTSPHADDHYGAMAPRSVCVVLEFEGEAEKESSRQRTSRTRLFAVDAGREPARLREKYPDISRHVIVRAVVRPFLRTRNPADGKLLAEPRLGGWIQEVQPNSVFVPPPHSTVLQGLPRRPGAERNGPPLPPRYAVAVSWGTHYEPWVRSVRLLPAPADGETKP